VDEPRAPSGRPPIPGTDLPHENATIFERTVTCIKPSGVAPATPTPPSGTAWTGRWTGPENSPGTEATAGPRSQGMRTRPRSPSLSKIRPRAPGLPAD